MGLETRLNSDTVATSPVVLRWLCDSPRMGCAWRTTPYIYLARTSNNRVIMACELYCCLLPQCEALRICRSRFPIATKWCCDQDVKVVRSLAFTQKTCDWCGSLWKGGMLLQLLRWCWLDCVIHHERDMREQHHTYMWREQAIIVWSWHENSIVACCHSAKLCAYAAQDFRSQQYQVPRLHHCLITRVSLPAQLENQFSFYFINSCHRI